MTLLEFRKLLTDFPARSFQPRLPGGEAVPECSLRLLRIAPCGVGNCGLHFARSSVPDIKKNELKPWLKKQWVIAPKSNAEFVAAMEDVLEVYARPPDAAHPLVCLDEP